VCEEIHADFTGDALADPRFLQIFARQNPTKFGEFTPRPVVRWILLIHKTVFGDPAR
jgi:hypothetical protein